MKELRTILKITLIAMTLVLLTSCEAEPIESNETTESVSDLLVGQWEIRVSNDKFVEMTLTVEGLYFMYLSKRGENGYSNRRIVRAGTWVQLDDTLVINYEDISLENQEFEFFGQFQVNNETLTLIDAIWNRMN